MTVTDRRTRHVVTPQEKIDAAERALAKFERENAGRFTEAHRRRMARLKQEIAAMRQDVEGDTE